MHYWLSGLATLLSTSLFAGDIYHWQDEKGVIHFSDVPAHPQAQSVTLPSSNTALRPSPAALTPTSAASTTITETVTIVFPAMDATIRSNAGNLRIQVQVSRTLAEDETLQLLVDGQPWGAPQRRWEWQLHNMDRGSHELSVRLQRSGKLIATSGSITVHLHRASVKSPRS
ncbi:DUF4124 domain-containing protein [Vibrio sp. V39_P1S14PM300]|uniref:DUF4124 domain-containing protein n=1 Tax=Vibrio sp. V39_P1S14PM300 TaxID=1938690 RepID=UPI0013729D53|nr:DUF4124 domain-containing protein [Vibrio sp. V39_P1S14PM300]NAX21921.1 DUF4124 domain-containing protein [Vibrio sp. V39_P1S14PM300]